MEIMRVFLDRLYLFSGYLAGAFMLAIFVLMMALSAGRPLGLNVPAATTSCPGAWPRWRSLASPTPSAPAR